MKKAIILIFALFLLTPYFTIAQPTHGTPLIQETTGGTETNLTFVNQTGAGTKPLVFNYVSEYKTGGVFRENGSRWYNNSDCIAYYPFDQNNKSDFCRNNDLYSSSGAVDSVKGRVLEGFEYKNAEADKLETDQDGNFQFSTSFCAGGWAYKKSNIISVLVIGSVGNGVQGGWYLYTDPTDGSQYRWTIYTGSEVATHINSNVIPINEWHHIVGVYDEEQLRMFFYQDGNITQNITLPSPLYMTDSLPFGVGGNSQVAGFNGILDEMFVYSNRTNCESHKIREIYEGTKAGFGIVNSSNYDGTTGNYAVNMTVCDSVECGNINRATGGDTTPPEITYYNLTSSDNGCESWNTNKNTACSTSSVTPVVQFNTSENAWCAIGGSSSSTSLNINYTDMGSSRNCTGAASGEGATSHLCTLTNQDEFVYDTSYLFISCKDSAGNQNRTSTSGALKLSVTGLETTRRNSIGLGIQNALLSSYTNYTDLQIYARNLSNAQVKGTFDRAAKKGTKIWAFNGIGVSDSHVNMSNLTPVLYTLEFTNTTSARMTNLTELLINATK